MSNSYKEYASKEYVDSKVPSAATPEADGLMSAADKSKLDGVENGATKAGKIVTGLELVVDEDGNTNIAKEGAEIFNNYQDNSAIGEFSHAEGADTHAIGDFSHAEGSYTWAHGNVSHTEGEDTHAIGDLSHAEGGATYARGWMAHAEGSSNNANGEASHAEGGGNYANGRFTHAEGYMTIATSENQHVQGKYNVEDSANKYAHIIGNGANNDRSNAHTLDWNGVAWFAGDVKVGGTGQDDTTAKTLATTDVATAATNGLMSATDKAKVDTVPASMEDTTYTTARYRGSALVATETDPTVNGVINWTYE